jgi:Ca2+-binding RTX toxin-like protein
LLGDGSGSFSDQSTFATGTSPYGVTVADFNGDGNPDIAVANSAADNVSVLLSPTLATISSVSAPTAKTYKAGDKLDFTVTFSKAVTVNKGTGNVVLPIALNTGGTVNATLSSDGASSTTHTFSYTVASGNFAPDGIMLGNSLVVSGNARISDADTNDIRRFDLMQVASTAQVLVDARPVPSPVPKPSEGTFGTALPIKTYKLNKKGSFLKTAKGKTPLVGGKFSDRLTGNNGNNRIMGKGANDTLTGKNGNDVMAGGRGNDLLIGGAGADTLKGGAGLDTFVYSSASEGLDMIQGFQGGQDLIDLRSIFAQSAYQMAGSSDFARFQKFVKIEPVGADTLVSNDSDGMGNGGFVGLATLKNVAASALGSQSFVVR